MEIRNNLIKSLKKGLCKEFEFEYLNKNFIKIYTPFIFDDGDQVTFGLELNAENHKWRLTDGSDTFIHLSNQFGEFKFYQGTRKELIKKFLETFSTEEKNGVLQKIFNFKEFTEEFYEFIQCILKVSDITILEREIVETTFKNDLINSLKTFLNKKSYKINIDYKFDYFHEKDVSKFNKIDCYIKTPKDPIYIFAIGSRYTCQNATISILWLEKKGVIFHPIAFFKDQIKIQPKVVAQLTDAAEKTISSLDEFDRFENYFEKLPEISRI